MALLPLLCVVALVAAIGVGTSASRSTPPSREAAVAAARRHARLAAATAWAVGLLAAVATGVAGRLSDQSAGVTAVQVPLAFGIAHVVVLLAGELSWPRPDGAVRRARLHRRGALENATRWHLAAGAAGLVLAAVTIGVGAVTADDGQDFLMTGAGGRIQSWGGPFAGWYYGAPAALGLAALAVTALVTLWVVAQRSAVATDDETAETALRRASAHRVLRVTDAVVLFVTGGLAHVSGNAVHSAAASLIDSAAANGLAVDDSPRVLSALGQVVGPAGLVLALAGLVVLVVPPPAVPVARPGAPVPVRS